MKQNLEFEMLNIRLQRYLSGLVNQSFLRVISFFVYTQYEFLIVVKNTQTIKNQQFKKFYSYKNPNIPIYKDTFFVDTP